MALNNNEVPQTLPPVVVGKQERADEKLQSLLDTFNVVYMLYSFHDTMLTPEYLKRLEFRRNANTAIVSHAEIILYQKAKELEAMFRYDDHQYRVYAEKRMEELTQQLERLYGISQSELIYDQKSHLYHLPESFKFPRTTIRH